MKGFSHYTSHLAEQHEAPKPRGEYFISRFNISGNVVSAVAVYETTTKNYANKTKFWRWRVRIKTSEGWMLMGYIGKSERQEELPPLRVGDVVEIRDLVLSRVTGGDWALRNAVTGKPLDYRSNLFSRQLHGKIKRSATPV
jgi:hypothetical protein